ncbi:IclR family transcriptional regulator [Luteipulveratus mongoliensis]|uniref:HTH iclR-type domain-containing protein n=1 Tax=Luteipulveratus mongoliensis TaxID=571913 RepID=A0A0K1JFC1_9MICO|nr:helix-turn-helix domain-containing protein [Luteipulveratus mongoliensis]AKU15290.1 hypothetical protein VV02_04480 [Luteipulveratus mongoliensis]
MKPAQPNQSLIDGLACLQALTAHAQPIGSRELGRMLDLEPTRVNRLLKTLAYVGLAQQDAQRKYLPGPGIHVLAAQSMRGSGLFRRAIDPLGELFDLELQVAMGVLWGDEVCYLYHVSPGDTPGQGLGREPLYPAALSGVGQALLAEMTDEQVTDLYEGPESGRHVIVPPAPVKLSGRGGLLPALKRARKQGYALSTTPESGGDRTLAIVLPGTPDVAIGVAGQFDDASVPMLLGRLRATATEIDTAGPA